jgi:hypothetical protein
MQLSKSFRWGCLHPWQLSALENSYSSEGRPVRGVLRLITVLITLRFFPCSECSFSWEIVIHFRHLC